MLLLIRKKEEMIQTCVFWKYGHFLKIILNLEQELTKLGLGLNFALGPQGPLFYDLSKLNKTCNFSHGQTAYIGNIIGLIS